MRDPLVRLWPKGLIAVQDVAVDFERPASAGPNPLIGRPQTVVSPAAGWRITYLGALAHRGNVTAFRAMLARHRGFAEPIYVGPYDYLNGPVERSGATGLIQSPFSDATIFSDGTRWETSLYDCTLAAVAAEGDVDISATNSVTAPLEAGDYFELDGRLHIVEEMDGTAWKIWPPLRADYSSGTALEIYDPRMKAYLDISGDAQTLKLQYGHWSLMSLSFVEAGW